MQKCIFNKYINMFPLLKLCCFIFGQDQLFMNTETSISFV